MTLLKLKARPRGRVLDSQGGAAPVLHSYLATLWPVDLPATEVEAHATARALPQLRVRAPNACLAAQAAARLSGQRVLEVERLEGACPASGPASASSSVAALAEQEGAV